MNFEERVQQLVDMGFDRSVAEREVTRQHPELARLFPVEPTKDDRVLENEEQREIVRIAGAYKFRVWNLSQYRPSKVARGFADLFLTHKWLPIALFWETKRQVGGARSTPQVEFGEDCTRCGVGYGFGDRYALVEKLIELEIAVRGDGQYGIEPVRHLRAG